MAQNPLQTLGAANEPKIHPPTISSMQDLVTDQRKLYELWVRQPEEAGLLADHDLPISAADRAKLAIDWLQWQIFTDCGRLSPAAELQLLTYLRALHWPELEKLCRGYWKGSGKDRRKRLRQINVAVPAGVQNLHEILVHQGLPATLPNLFRGLSEHIEQAGTACLDLLLDQAVEAARSPEQVVGVICLATAHLRRQLEGQNVALPDGVLEALPWEWRRPRKGGHIRTVNIDLEIHCRSTPVSGQQRLGRRVVIRAPPGLVMSDNFLGMLQVFLETHWALCRLSWSLLGVSQLSLNGRLFLELAGPTQTAFRRRLLSESLEELLRSARTPANSMEQLISEHLLGTQTRKLYKRANPQQLQIIQNLQRTHPVVVAEALAFGPDTPACALYLAKHFPAEHPSHQLLKSLA